MKKLLALSFVITALISFGCNNPDSKSLSATTASSPASVPGGEGKATITVMKDEKLVISYTCSIPNATRILEKSGEASLMMYLNSPDSKFSLLGTIMVARSGTYPLSDDGKGPAQIEMYSDGKSMLPRVVPDKGSFKLSLEEKTCSGSFTGTKKAVDGKDYKISGEFTNIPVITNNTAVTN